MKLLVLLVALFACGIHSVAQPVPDSKGTEFWFTFLPNFHNNADQLDSDPTTAAEHHIRIEIAADGPARGEIRLTSRAGVVTIVPFVIARAQDVFSYQTFYRPFELVGFNTGSAFLDYNNSQCNRVALQSVQVVSDNEVSVYGLNQAPFTSDAFMVLPVDAIGRDYIVMSYPSNRPQGAGSDGDTPSQFAVVAVEDSTMVEIRPRAPIVRNTTMAIDTVYLNRGESYLVQADMRINVFGDLTGTSVIASRPVAVFGGHQRTSLPSQQTTLRSRDCLIEQMNPVESWGKRAFIAPFRPSRNEDNVGTDLYRVVARFDRTVLTANGVEVATINAGGFYQAPLTGPVDLRASRPVMVAALKKTSSVTTQANRSADGDPLMVLVPPEEQFMNGYTFVSIQTQRVDEFNQLEDVYTEQYVSVVMPNATNPTRPSNNLRLDGLPISPVFTPIGTSGWRYTTVPLSSGVHTISADTLIGIYVYGYGQAVSYGYIGGTAFRPLDVYPPTMSINRDCDSVRIVFTDSLPGDKGLRSIDVVEQENVNVVTEQTIDSFMPVAVITAVLDNPYADGWVRARGVDIENQDQETRLDIAGFTIAPVGHGAAPDPYVVSLVQPVRKSRCTPTRLVNYGRFAQTITAARRSSGLPTGLTLPLTIPPGGEVVVQFCWSSLKSGADVDTLFLQDSCVDRTSVIWQVESVWDTDAPRLSVSGGDPCDVFAEVIAIEDTDYDFGIERMRLVADRSFNVEVVDGNVTVDRASLRLRRVDAFRDLIWVVEATDSAGNVRELVDTVAGYTLAITRGGAPNEVVFEGVSIGTVACDSIVAENFGMFPLRIQNPFLLNNVLFSVPLAQFPLELAPGERRNIAVCYAPEWFGGTDAWDTDTLLIASECAQLRVDLRGLAEILAYYGISRCSVPVAVEATSTRNLVAMPVPASDFVTIVAAREIHAATIRLIDATGTEVRRWLVPREGGGRAVNLDIRGVVAGVYGVVILDEVGVLRVPVVVK